MPMLTFEALVNGLRGDILANIKIYLAAKGISFCGSNFLDETSFNVEDLAKEALFYGAATFPEIADTEEAQSI